jgi:PII-like signaling protein
METSGQAVLLRIFIGESDTWLGKSLHTALVEEARNQGLAGATVVRGSEGFGANRHIHTARLVDISPDLPMIVEIVDEEAKIQAFLGRVEQMVGNGLVTLERVTVHIYRGGRKAEA